jgi:hypothetical protein
MSYSNLAVNAAKALAYAHSAAMKYASLKYDGGILEKSELPPELMTRPALVLIHFLPRIFKKLGMPNAALFNEIWRHGPTRFRGLKRDASLEGSPYYWVFSWAQFSKISPALEAALSGAVLENIKALKNILSEQGSQDPRWKRLKTFVGDVRKKKEWKGLSTDYRWALRHPDILLQTVQMTTSMYDEHREVKTDSYASLGPCAIRIYLLAEFIKKKDSDVVVMRPRRIGARIWDDYNFNDSILDYLTGLIADGTASQFLGNWINNSDGSLITLHNSDFQEYKNWFKPIYNQHLARNRGDMEKILDCTDFHLISTWFEKEIESGEEYAIPATWI